MYTRFNIPKPLDTDTQNILLGIGICSEIPDGNKKRIIEHNLSLALHIAQKFHNTGIELDDLFQIGSVGLIKAADTFNPMKKTKFITYATTCIVNEILMYLRRSSKHKNHISLKSLLVMNSSDKKNTLIMKASDENILIEETVCDISQSFEEDSLDHVISSEVLAMVNKLDDKLKIIVMTRIIPPNGIKVNQIDLAQKLDVDQSYISRLEKKALKKLETYLYQYR